jgi:prophage maintenance system killer protein
LNRPTVEIAVAINHAVRHEDEWFDEPDELKRLERALTSIDQIDDPIDAAAIVAFRVTRAQAFAEANKRTALLLGRWILDRNGLSGAKFLPADDRQVAELLVQAARGQDVEHQLVELLRTRV